MVAMARLPRLSPTMANLGLSLSIPLSASVDTARAPQFLGLKQLQVPERKPQKLEEMIHILGFLLGILIYLVGVVFGRGVLH